MPELPEVETTLRGIDPYLRERKIQRIDVRETRLRWPVPSTVQQACQQRVQSVWRRAKYIIIGLENGSLLLHLGMSGSLRVLTGPSSPGKHDHFDIVLKRSTIRFNDPRRFGLLLWCDRSDGAHPLLASLGPEPLLKDFSGTHLYQRSRGRKLAVKNFIMDGKVVVGVGNIYASEALYMAGIHPLRAAGRVGL